MQLPLRTIMATATSIHDRLADFGDAVLATVVGGAEAGACCSDNGLVCFCEGCPNSFKYRPYVWDCNCACKRSEPLDICVDCTVGG